MVRTCEVGQDEVEWVGVVWGGVKQDWVGWRWGGVREVRWGVMGWGGAVRGGAGWHGMGQDGMRFGEIRCSVVRWSRAASSGVVGCTTCGVVIWAERIGCGRCGEVRWPEAGATPSAISSLVTIRYTQPRTGDREQGRRGGESPIQLEQVAHIVWILFTRRDHSSSDECIGTTQLSDGRTSSICAAGSNPAQLTAFQPRPAHSVRIPSSSQCGGRSQRTSRDPVPGSGCGVMT